jgi:hypothetical protein
MGVEDIYRRINGSQSEYVIHDALAQLHENVIHAAFVAHGTDLGLGLLR